LRRWPRLTRAWRQRWDTGRANERRAQQRLRCIDLSGKVYPLLLSAKRRSDDPNHFTPKIEDWPSAIAWAYRCLYLKQAWTNGAYYALSDRCCVCAKGLDPRKSDKNNCLTFMNLSNVSEGGANVREVQGCSEPPRHHSRCHLRLLRPLLDSQET
jgi:hypothetical protein